MKILSNNSRISSIDIMSLCLSYTLSMAMGSGSALAGSLSYVTIDVPGASSTVAQGINNAGQIVGIYSTFGNSRLPSSH